MGSLGRNDLIILGGYVIIFDKCLKMFLCFRNVLVHYVILSRYSVMLHSCQICLIQWPLSVINHTIR